jgi:hypothetical protein
MSRVRADIAKETAHLQTRTSEPTKGDLQKAIRVLQYLKAFPATPAVYHTSEGVRLCAHTDASHANQPGGVSTACLYLTIGSTGAPFLSKSYALDDIATDPAAAEYMAVGLVPVKLALRFRNFLASIGFSQDLPTPVFTDNQPVIDMSISHTIPRKSRYMESRHHFIREQVARGTLKLIKRDTNVHGPDLGTKPHGPQPHHALTKITMNLGSLPLSLSPPVPVI